MAKLGEGDDRWIVKERDDGKNCNNWHWSETNLTEWSKERLTELLVGIVAMEEGSSSGWCALGSRASLCDTRRRLRPGRSLRTSSCST